MVRREVAASNRMRLTTPARTAPAMAHHMGLDRPFRQAAPGAGPSRRMVGPAPEAVGEARAVAAVAAALVPRRPATGADVSLAAGTDAGLAICVTCRRATQAVAASMKVTMSATCTRPTEPDADEQRDRCPGERDGQDRSSRTRKERAQPVGSPPRAPCIRGSVGAY